MLLRLKAQNQLQWQVSFVLSDENELSFLVPNSSKSKMIKKKVIPQAILSHIAAGFPSLQPNEQQKYSMSCPKID